MTEHNQTEIIVEGYPMQVDEGLEDVIANFFYWEIETCNSCIDMDGFHTGSNFAIMMIGNDFYN